MLKRVSLLGLAIFLTVALLLLPLTSRAATVEVDPTYVPSIGSDYQLIDFVIQSDGRLVIAKGERNSQVSFAPELVRFNNNGAADPTFNGKPSILENRSIRHTVAQPDDKILVTGSLEQGEPYLARLLPNGNPDPSFTQRRFTGWLAVLPDKKILAGSTESGNTNVTRLNEDGTTDLSFELTPFLTVPRSYTAELLSLVSQPDGKFLVNYWVKHVNDYTAPSFFYLLRFNPDGTPDPSFDLDPTLRSGYVGLKAIQPDGKVLVEVPVGYASLYRLNSNGSIDPAFNCPLQGNFNSVVALRNDKILIGGNFQGGVAQLNPNGTPDSTFDVGTGPGGSNVVTKVAPVGNDKVVVSGWFSSFSGVARDRLLRLLYTPNTSLINQSPVTTVPATPTTTPAPKNAARLETSLRVESGRIFANSESTLVTFTFKIKNSGLGAARGAQILFPNDPNFEIAYTALTDKEMWLSQITTDTIFVTLPKTFNAGQEINGQLIFRSKVVPSGTQTKIRYQVSFGDARRDRNLQTSNAVSLSFEAKARSGDAQVQPMPGSRDAATGRWQFSTDVMMGDETVTGWLTKLDGTSIELVKSRSSDDGTFSMSVDPAALSLAPGDYAVVLYGNTSGNYAQSSLTVNT